MSQILRTTARSVIGLSLAVVLIYSLIRHSGADLRGEFGACRYGLLVAAFALNGTAHLMGTYRWKLLLDVQGVQLPFFRLFQLTMVSVFFSLVIPGAVSGDIVKMVYVAGHSHGKKAEAALTIMLDRVLGLFGLFVVSSLSILASLSELRQASPAIQLGAVVVAVASIAGTLFAIGVWAWKPLDDRFHLAHRLRSRLSFIPHKVLAICERLAAGFTLYREKRGVIMVALALSVLVHTTISMVILTIGRGFHETQAGAGQYILTTQVANVIGAIPITPAGFGSRDLVLATFLRDAGAERGKAAVIAAGYSMMMAGWGLVGGLIFVTMKHQRAIR